MLFFSVSRLFQKLNGVEGKPMSDNNAPRTKYDVFVSFRGVDIRDGFLSHLTEAFHRKEIEAFVDDKLERGDEIWPSLVGSIEGSATSVIIFSQDYASSRWCLEELVAILECREKSGQIVIPVFYHVEPTDIRHQTGSYENAFVEHGEKYDSTKMESWRRALNKSAHLSGIKSSDFRNDARLIEEIVSLVLTRLDEPSVNSRGLIGIDKKIAHVESLICQETKGTRVIGIWGMGGMGKTTIAEEVFNRLKSKYEGCCFLANEREESKKQGIISLKKSIFSTLLREDVKIDTSNGLPINILRRIGSKKVLIVLDDVNNSDHLEKVIGTPNYFGSGSRIIVTTRDKQVLIANKVDDIYHVERLSSSEEIELFNLNVFNQGDLQMECNELSMRVVNYAKGIPLVLKVLARLLFGKDKEIWESLLDKLKKMPNKDVFEIMRLSYDDLDRKEQQIFLDLACFFLGLDVKVNVGYLKSLLKDSESDNSLADGLERLKDKALITFSEDNFISMHDIIQEMAWEIVRLEPSRSRLWDPDDTYEVLKNDKGTEAIRSIRIPLSTFRMQKLSTYIFAKMSKLQFLDISGEHNQDCFHLLAEGLKFLSTELRFLCWYYYPLESLPENFSTEKLVMLKLKNSKIEKLWHGVKNLVNLKQVDLSLSKNLEELPDFSSAINLEVLNLGYCTRLTSVHPSIFSLEKLEELNLMSCTSLTKLASESHLSSLSSLLIDGCHNLTEFSLQTLPKLVCLYVGYCTSLQTLPELSPSLSTLYAQNCTSLQTLPELPPSLATLNAEDCTSLQTLPELPPSLSTLYAGNCTSLQTLPELPASLSTLDVQNCTSLQTLPELPPSLSTLYARNCTSLQTLPELPPSLSTLYAQNCTSLQTLPELPLSLSTLNAENCTLLQILPKLPPSLSTLYARNCTSLQTLPELPPSLSTLDVQNCTSLQTLPELPPSLSTLYVGNCTSLQTLLELPPSLSTLDVQNCTSLQTLPKLPPSLSTLYARNCTSLQTLPELPPSLSALDVQNCTSLQTLPELPLSLSILYFNNCTSLQTLPELPPFTSFQTVPDFIPSPSTLDFENCTSLQTVPELPPSLSTLYFNNCTSLQTLPQLPPSLSTLDLQNCRSLQTLPQLPPSLSTLDLQNCTSLQTLPQLPPSLSTLDFENCISLKTLPELPSSLSTLYAQNCISLQTLPELPPSLSSLYVQNCISLQALPELPPSLEVIDVVNCRQLQTVLLPSTAIEQLKENRGKVLFWNCSNLDQHSLVTIGLNAQINVMKFANRHLSALHHDHVENYNDYYLSFGHYQAVYVYPGSDVPEWLEYRTIEDYIIIDLPPATPSHQLGFIFCFALGEFQLQSNFFDNILEFNITVSDGDGGGKKDSLAMYITCWPLTIESDHVCVMFNLRCSDFLNSKAKNQTRFKIKVKLSTKEGIYTEQQRVLKGFGVSPISTMTCNNFIQQMELRDSVPQFH